MRRLDEIVDGDPDLLRDLLQAFSSDHTGAADAIEESLAAQRDNEALRMAHNLKGSAANLGARKLSQAAQALERLLKAKAAGEALRPALLSLRSELATILDAVAAFLAQTTAVEAGGGAVAADSAAARALCTSLSRAIEGHELIPHAQLAALKSALNGCAAKSMQQLELCLSRYDFIDAQKALVAIELELL
ncbi:MAG: Hpt domain-containing protein [Sulfuritalea sp.]|nr:Hpt domain-containing protein [Sulfuritalea sp.]